MTALRTISTRVTAIARTRGSIAVSNRRNPAAVATASATATATAARTLHQSAAARQPYKDDMDRESLKPKAHENTQSGTDDEIAHGDEAFNRQNTDPDSERASAASESSDGKGGSALEGSPANKDFASQKTGAREDRTPGGAGNHSKPSGSGNAPKKGKV